MVEAARGDGEGARAAGVVVGFTAGELTLAGGGADGEGVETEVAEGVSRPAVFCFFTPSRKTDFPQDWQ